MTQRTYSSYSKLEKAAKEKGKKVEETPVSFYFRIFENKQCTELHIFYKK